MATPADGGNAEASAATAAAAAAAAVAAPSGPLHPFSLPTVHINHRGWGPTALPEQYENTPFASFNRYDRLGKCADFGGYLRYHSRACSGRGGCGVRALAGGEG